MKKTRLSNVVKPARVRLGYCLTYIFANLRETRIQISLLLILSMFWRFLLPPAPNRDEKLTFKNKTQINIIVSYLSLCEKNLLFSWLKQKRVLFCLLEKQLSLQNQLKPMCTAAFMDFLSLQSYLCRTSSARGSRKCFRGLFCLVGVFYCSALIAEKFIRDKVL